MQADLEPAKQPFKLVSVVKPAMHPCHPIPPAGHIRKHDQRLASLPVPKPCKHTSETLSTSPDKSPCEHLSDAHLMWSIQCSRREGSETFNGEPVWKSAKSLDAPESFDTPAADFANKPSRDSGKPVSNSKESTGNPEIIGQVSKVPTTFTEVPNISWKGDQLAAGEQGASEAAAN